MSKGSQLLRGDCLETLPRFPANTFTAVVTDPPYGLKFMGKEWDHGIPGKEFWVEILRVCKPGAFLLAFGGTRTFHRLACAIEDAGWELRDTIMWVYGSGFPKSHDISKAIDKAAGAEMPIGKSFTVAGNVDSKMGEPTPVGPERDAMRHTPSTPLAQLWDGWGTALKPAWEPIVVAMKPIEGTFAANAEKHGVAGLNVDGCRVESDDHPGVHKSMSNELHEGYQRPWRDGGPPQYKPTPSGRWPANLIHDGSDEVLEGFPETTSGGRSGPNKSEASKDTSYSGGWDHVGGPCAGDSGSAARFFYCAKASKSERNKGLDSTYTVKYSVSKSIPKGDLLCKGVSMVLVRLLKRATLGSTVSWLIDESGENIMGLCPRDSLSIILTEISKITESRILHLLTPQLIRESIVAASCEKGSGGNPAKSVGGSNQSTETTGISQERVGLCMEGVRSVISKLLSMLNELGNWHPVTNTHPCVKPLKLMEYLVKLVSSPQGSYVLDPFCGSGSTLIACKRLGVKYVGIDEDPKTVLTAIRRLRKVSP